MRIIFLKGANMRFIKRIINFIFRQFKQIERKKEIKKTAPRIEKTNLIDDLRALGLKRGDIVLFHSSLKSIGYVVGGARTVIEAILEVISPDGTLMIPTYSSNSMLKTCLNKDYCFDPRETDTVLGKIPSTFLKMPNIHRSIHPTHSVAAIGKYAQYLTEAHHFALSTFGYNSPWERLMKLDGKMMGIGVTLWPVPIYHVLEDMMSDKFPLPVRMKETYMVKCRDWFNKLIEVPVTPLDPKYKKIRIDNENRQDLRTYMWKEYIHAGIVKTGKVGAATGWITSINKFYDHLILLMREGITIYSTPEELKKRPIW